ncbi:MAG: acyl-CoA dehydrogenase family protein [Hydrogenophaga sp.]|uniref:acyl-CoA dehydrogenase family protein n=1 Tax=Hydrogenophaga sp. TaxID=1904254 RepID=UPI002604ED20|nr:acyl-CoA dehydrogenase family protein [Hydrogenophaga sp.]MDM7944545.1 acyl-CoA dehydrogenase family protein [Hydrogenophaga sp.]
MQAASHPDVATPGRASRTVAEHFATQCLVPHAAEWARGGWERRALFEAAGAAGLLGLQVPHERGGLALSFTDTAQVLHRLAGADFGAAMALVNSHNVATLLLRYSPDGLAPACLPDLLSGRTVACTALTEPDTGSDLAQLKTLASPSGDGWLLSGEKTWIINAAHADGVVVYAQTKAGAGVKGMAAFWVDAHAPGFERRPVSSSGAFNSMGLGGFVLNQVFCKPEQMVCPPGVAFADIMDGINRARTYVAAMCCGMVAQALATASAYGQQRQAFGKPLTQHQGWRWQLAQAATALKAGELLVADACARIDQGADVQAEAAQAKLYATSMAQTQLGELLHAMGAEGFLDRHPFLRHLAATHAAALADGSTAMLLERVAQNFRLKPGES